jgi:hypothetical protein
LKNKSVTRQQNWLDLIGEGGDLTRDIGVTGLCSNQPSLIPYKRSNRPKYLEFEPERTAAAWYVEKMGAEDSFSTKDCGNRALIGGFREGMSQESLKINAVLTSFAIDLSSKNTSSSADEHPSKRVRTK